jgi:hypothetical protein
MSTRESLKEVHAIQVIRTSNKTVGGGSKEDPVRTVVQYWTIDGELLDECDPHLQGKGKK